MYTENSYSGVFCEDRNELFLIAWSLLNCVEKRVRDSKAAGKFSDPGNADFLVSDLELALKIDLFSFAMEVVKEDSNLILRKAYRVA